MDNWVVSQAERQSSTEVICFEILEWSHLYKLKQLLRTHHIEFINAKTIAEHIGSDLCPFVLWIVLTLRSPRAVCLPPERAESDCFLYLRWSSFWWVRCSLFESGQEKRAVAHWKLNCRCTEDRGKIVYLRGTNCLQIAHACSMNIYSAVFGAKSFVNIKEREKIDWQGCLAFRVGGDRYN